MKKFEDYLQDQHALDFTGTDDMMPDDYEEWLQDISIDDWIEFGQKYHNEVLMKLGDEGEIQKIVILGALETKINKEENKVFVFICCGKPGKKIETRGLCPHCNKENVEVVNLWKYDLAKAIAKRIKETL